MAFVDHHESPLPSPSHPPVPVPRAALKLLAELHSESRATAGLGRFLQSAVHAAGLLTVLGAAALALGPGNSLKACFAWALLVLLGVGALLHSYIRSTASAFDRAPLTKAA